MSETQKPGRPSLKEICRRGDLAVVFAAMALVALVQAVYWQRVNPALAGDLPRYIYLAKGFLAGDLYQAIHFHYPPLYPLYLCLFLPFHQHPETAARLAAVSASMLTVIPIFLISRLLYNRSVAAIAVLFWPLKFMFPPLEAEAEIFFNLVLYIAIWAGLMSLESKRPVLVLASGALFGLANLAKMEGQAFFLFWLMLILVNGISRGSGLRATATRMALAGAGCLAVMAPYLGAYALETGKLSLNPKTPALFYGYNEPEWDQAWYSLRRDETGLFTMHQRVIAEGDRRPLDISPARYALANWKRLAPAYLDRLSFTATDIIPYFLWLLMPRLPWAAGLVILAGVVRINLRDGQLGKEAQFAGFGTLTLAAVPLFTSDPRLFASLAPMLVIFLARGAERIGRRMADLAALFRPGAEPGKARIAAWAVLVVTLSIPNLLHLRHLPAETNYHEIARERREIAEWLRPRLSPGAKIMSMWGRLPLWSLAGLSPQEDLAPPRAPLPELLEYARQEKVEYIIVSNHEYPGRYPDLVPLLWPDFRHPELERERAFPGAGGRYYFIYKRRER